LGAYECSACGYYFKTDRAFQAHRAGPQGNRRCLAPDEPRALPSRSPRFPTRLTLASALSYCQRTYDVEPQPTKRLQQALEFIRASGWYCVWSGDAYGLECSGCGKCYERPKVAAKHRCPGGVDQDLAA
jgi:hypothetical protein